MKPMNLRRLTLWLLLLSLWALPPPLRAQAVASPTHTVAAGESLSEIAQRYGLTQAELMALNSIADPDAIYAGQILVLPAPQPAATPPVVEVDPAYAAAEPEVATTHTVEAGDTLSTIAQRYGLSEAELMALNGIVDPDTIGIGQKLRLTPAPATGAAQAAPAAPQGSGNPVASLNRVYTVQTSDTLEQIALRFGVDVSSLRQLNRVESSVDLAADDTLLLPATRQELAPPQPAPADPGADDPAAGYAVEAGDSLGVIAQAHGLTLAELMEANQIANPDAIYVGQRLALPTPVVETPATGAATETMTETVEAPLPAQIGPPRAGFFYYTVKAGDTLSELARDFDSTVLALLEYNDLPDEQTVFSGLELKIPYGPPPLPGAAPPVPRSGTRFVVSLSRQQCWVIQGEQLRYAWTCSTGYGEWITRTGTFAVQTKQETAKSTAYQLDMPYWLGIYDVGTYENGIHGLPILWKTGEKIWSTQIGRPATFGCAMLDDDDAATLFDLAYLGMPVHIVP
ncbi:MAG: LysM peptidoglycan-binding domain-containing protein [Caldilineaceae bacterium]|nr:LysM peptidoglycan-binding domain-containing protein [Caldilineaceae bacterium]